MPVPRAGKTAVRLYGGALTAVFRRLRGGARRRPAPHHPATVYSIPATSAPGTQGGVCSSGVATAIPSAPPPTASTTTSRATTTLFLARRRALGDLHPWSRGELTVLTDDLRRIKAEVGTRLSAGNRGRGTGERERQRGARKDQRFMIVLRCMRSRTKRAFPHKAGAQGRSEVQSIGTLLSAGRQSTSGDHHLLTIIGHPPAPTTQETRGTLLEAMETFIEIHECYLLSPRMMNT